MTMTRDQLRAARMLLHLKQDVLAELTTVGLATIRRFETGSEIRPPQLAALRAEMEKAGAIFVDSSTAEAVPPFSVGVLLKPIHDLPDGTLARIASDEAREAARIEAERRRIEDERTSVACPKRRGRPKKVTG